MSQDLEIEQFGKSPDTFLSKCLINITLTRFFSKLRSVQNFTIFF